MKDVVSRHVCLHGWTGLLACLALTYSLFAPLEGNAEGFGHVQIVCEAGVSVFVDGKLAGVTSDEFKGLLLDNIAAGERELKFVRLGFTPKLVTLQVAKNSVTKYEVKSLVPELRISQEGRTENTAVLLKTGTLVIQSLPVECLISIRGIGLTNQAKNSDVWKAEAVPAGRYQFEFLSGTRELKCSAAVEENGQLKLFANFLRGEVIDVTQEERKQKAAEEAKQKALEIEREKAAEVAREREAKAAREVEARAAEARSLAEKLRQSIVGTTWEGVDDDLPITLSFKPNGVTDRKMYNVWDSWSDWSQSGTSIHLAHKGTFEMTFPKDGPPEIRGSYAPFANDGYTRAMRLKLVR